LLAERTQAAHNGNAATIIFQCLFEWFVCFVVASKVNHERRETHEKGIPENNLWSPESVERMPGSQVFFRRFLRDPTGRHELAPFGDYRFT